MNNHDLKAERNRRGFTQDQMAKFLAETPVSTYRKWEQGINDVPAWVDSILVPKSMVIPGLTLAEIVELDVAARAKGITMDELIGELIRKGLKGGMALILLALSAWQLCHPENDQFARMFGRRRDSVDAVEVMGEA